MSLNFSKTSIRQKQNVLKYFVYMQLQHNFVANTPSNGPSIIFVLIYR